MPQLQQNLWYPPPKGTIAVDPRVTTYAEGDQPALGVSSVAVVHDQTHQVATYAASEPVPLKDDLTQTAKEPQGSVEPAIAKPAAPKKS